MMLEWTRRTLVGERLADGPPSWRRAMAAERRRWAVWADAPGVLGFAAGRREADGRLQDEPALTVYVEAKRPESRLAAPIPRSLVLPDFDAPVPVDVVAIGIGGPESDPQAPALRVAGRGLDFGSLGGVAFDAGSPPRVFLLTAAHVLMPWVDHADPAPEPVELALKGGGWQRVSKAVQLNPFFLQRGYKNRVDAALVELLPGITPPLLAGWGMPLSLAEDDFYFAIGREVFIQGATSGTVSGKIRQPSASIGLTGYWDSNNRPRTLWFNDVVVCERFTSKGDSGAAVLDDAGRLMGLHFWGGEVRLGENRRGEECSIFCKIRNVLAAFRNPIIEPETSLLNDRLGRGQAFREPRSDAAAAAEGRLRTIAHGVAEGGVITADAAAADDAAADDGSGDVVMALAPDGHRTVHGPLVLRLQGALKKRAGARSHFDPGKLDGFFGADTAQALRLWRRAHTGADAPLIEADEWAVLTGEREAPSLFERCLQVTASFEGHGFTKPTGDDDRQVLTWGIIGFTWAGGSLRDLLRAVDQATPEAIDDAFGDLAGGLRHALDLADQAAIDWGRQTMLVDATVKPDWEDALRRLGENAAVQKQQLRLAKATYWTPAQQAADAQGMSSPLSLGLLYDLSVQAGPAGMRTHIANAGLTAGQSEPDKRRAIVDAYARSLAGHDRSNGGAEARKRTFETGSGSGYFGTYDLGHWGLAEPGTVVEAAEGDEAEAHMAGSSVNAADRLRADADAPPPTPGSFEARFATWNIRHFEPAEFFYKGADHGNPSGRGYRKNADPPDDLWDNARPLAQALDEIRRRLGASVRLTSVYRSKDYNKAVGGVPNSYHRMFKAADFIADDGRGPHHWAATARAVRDDGYFTGGIGTYGSFVHIDVRGYNVDF